VRFTARATDADLPLNTLTFSLDASSPTAATIHPQTGAFRWFPTTDYAGLSNLVTVIVTDNGVPALSATQSFTVAVEDFVKISFGNTTVPVNTTSSVPLTAQASAPWQTLNFTLPLTPGILSNLTLNSTPPFTTATLTPLDAAHWQFNFSNASGHALSGTQTLAQLGFRATASNSAFVPLVPENISATRTTGEFFPRLLPAPGRVVIVGTQPLLDAHAVISNRHQLTLFGNPGQTYQVDTASNLAVPTLWQPYLTLTLTNLAQPLDANSNNTPSFYYRIH
jgi:hypothetical protein